MKNTGLLSHLRTAFARLRGIVDAGPGNTSGEPVSVAGHLLYARPSSGTLDASELPPQAADKERLTGHVGPARLEALSSHVISDRLAKKCAAPTAVMIRKCVLSPIPAAVG